MCQAAVRDPLAHALSMVESSLLTHRPVNNDQFAAKHPLELTRRALAAQWWAIVNRTGNSLRSLHLLKDDKELQDFFNHCGADVNWLGSWL